jgi:hypothetical protein
MDKTQKTKAQKIIRRANVLESLKDIGSDASKNLLNQVLGRFPFEQKYSGEINPGETLEFKDLMSGKHEENIKLQRQLFLERKLTEEEKIHSAQKSNELKVQLQALMQEVLNLAKTTQNLSQEVETAVMQAPAQPGIYHLIFFKKLLEFVQSFRKKIENASVWLGATNRRAEKKNYWSMYKKKGASFLLSPDHYLSRSAG